MKHPVALIIIGFLCALLTTLAFMILTRPQVSQGTKEICAQQAKRRASDYVGTKWEGFDIYTSCIENLLYANPYNRF